MADRHRVPVRLQRRDVRWRMHASSDAMQGRRRTDLRRHRSLDGRRDLPERVFERGLCGRLRSRHKAMQRQQRADV